MTCLLFLDANEYAARGRVASVQQKTRRGLPPGHSGVVSVNTLLWSIRGKQKICDAIVVSLSCCHNSGFARVRYFEWAKSDCGWERHDRRERCRRSRLRTMPPTLVANPRGCGASATVFHGRALHAAHPFHRGGRGDAEI